MEDPAAAINRISRLVYTSKLVKGQSGFFDSSEKKNELAIIRENIYRFLKLDNKYSNKQEKKRREPITNKILNSTEREKKKGTQISITELSHISFPFLEVSEKPKNEKNPNFKTENLPSEVTDIQFDKDPKECEGCKTKFSTFKGPVPCQNCVKFFCKDCCSNNILLYKTGSLKNEKVCAPCYRKVTLLPEKIESSNNCSTCKTKISGKSKKECKVCGDHFCENCTWKIFINNFKDPQRVCSPCIKTKFSLELKTPVGVKKCSTSTCNNKLSGLLSKKPVNCHFCGQVFCESCVNKIGLNVPCLRGSNPICTACENEVVNSSYFN
eukprot:TRINITY_DN5147_c0_g2_i1.p1 TRINITY_DN5147_c0_g2~~TRINITY_DN5147_c0_g2_i1.p1  ORF type:complete len:364 (+),score=92.01 TRINITY_DN5147_c0_g2_i1:120-1094(+)